MSFEADYLDMMPHTVAVYPWASASMYGEATYSTSGTTYSCLIQDKFMNIVNLQGEDVTVTTVVHVASTTPLEATAKYVLNNGSTTMEPTLASISRLYDEDGLHHHVLYFGSV